VLASGTPSAKLCPLGSNLQLRHWLQVREMRFHCANGLVLLRICAPSEGALVALLQKMSLVGSSASFSFLLLYSQHKPGVGKLVQLKSHLQKIKNTSESQNQLLCQYKYGKECKFYIKSVVLNLGYTYPLGVPNTATGGTKHQHF